ncbi:MAG: isoleucine--tRNA ligase [Candidatus Marinimicrobia bacterium]|nr:isoleucine--tRNA ligase [Candidatus Neomarinimicrobiota bacterium]|tara:strand:+ start:11476 stop:14787 length:3312 start_codon:yes stop_codon:yes gene_type:complete
MPIKKVDAKVDFIKLEHEVLEFWRSNHIFQKQVEKNKGKTKWSFIDGPITANNPMGVHHAWGRSLKDIYQRYKAMKGHELRYQNGFDCQGLWVEVEVEKELGFSTKREVEEYGIEKFVQMCKDRVHKYSKIQTEQSKRLGYWMDWDNSYFTMSDENNYTIWSFLKRLFDRGKVYKGTDVVPWSGRSGTSYSQMEIIEGRKLVAHKSVFVRFPLVDKENEYLLVWTTTPWTLTSNVVCGINGNLEYVKVRSADGSIYYFAEENLGYQRLEKQFREKSQWIEGVPKLKTIAQLFKERGGFENLGTIKGSELKGLKYQGPFDDLPAQSILGGYPITNKILEEKNESAITQHRVIDPGKDSIGRDIVVAGEGTGIVHMAPGCGDIDHRIGEKENLVNIAPLDEESKFKEEFGWLNGKSATDRKTTSEIIDHLKEKGYLFHVEDYPHVYPHCWRSGDELVFRLVDEWYINMDWRGEIKKVVDDIEWIPEWGREREHEWLENMGDWMISKKRFWGLALPIWTFEDSSFIVVGSKEELKELAVEGWDEFEGNSPHRPWIDKVKIRHPETGLVGTRILDVGNPWLDAGIVPFSTMNYNSDREYWQKWFPGDFVTECFPGQFRNWFYSLLAMSTALEGKAPFKTLLGHALVKDETGRDMHKSWGNAIWFEDAAEKMGVDVMRWMYASQNVEHHLLFGYGPAKDVRKKLITLWNIYSFFATYAAVDGFEPGKINLKDEVLSLLDKWILSKTNVLIEELDSHLDTFKLDKAMKKIERFLEDLSNWYVRRNRRRFWKTEDDMDKQIAYQTLFDVLENLIKILAPILPFVTENIYQNLVKTSIPSAPQSVHLCDYPQSDKSLIDIELMKKMDLLKKVIELGRNARNKADLKIRQPLASIVFHVPEGENWKFILDNQNTVLEELNVKTIRKTDSPDELIQLQVKPNLKILGQILGSKLPELRKFLDSKSSGFIADELKIKKEIIVELNKEKFTLNEDDFIMDFLSEKGFSSSSDNGITVGLSTELSEPLIQEGIVRDIIRQVQILRKDAGFAVEDRIQIYTDWSSTTFSAVENFKDYFCAETLTVNIAEYSKGKEYDSYLNIQDDSFPIALSRNKNK